jgi:BirA family biotin operon repressor/biotin-[acetyl-CoA-carboxylase] ligase
MYNSGMPPENLSQDPFAGALKSLCPAVRHFTSLGSTMDEALAWADAGAADGALVIADEQTEGRGRLGRKWITQPGAALAFTLILKPSVSEQEHLALFSPLAGLAVALAAESLGLAPQIKWPNDVLLGRKKICGILSEANWFGTSLQNVLIGIGINLQTGAVPPPDLVMFPAGCLEEFSNHPIDQVAFLANVIDNLFKWRQRLGTPEFMQAWQCRLAFMNEGVQIDQPGQPPVVGRVLGLAPNGDLKIMTAEGQMLEIAAGDVRLRPAG